MKIEVDDKHVRFIKNVIFVLDRNDKITERHGEIVDLLFSKEQFTELERDNLKQELEEIRKELDLLLYFSCASNMDRLMLFIKTHAKVSDEIHDLKIKVIEYRNFIFDLQNKLTEYKNIVNDRGI